MTKQSTIIKKLKQYYGNQYSNEITLEDTDLSAHEFYGGHCDDSYIGGYESYYSTLCRWIDSIISKTKDDPNQDQIIIEKLKEYCEGWEKRNPADVEEAIKDDKDYENFYPTCDYLIDNADDAYEMGFWLCTYVAYKRFKKLIEEYESNNVN